MTSLDMEKTREAFHERFAKYHDNDKLSDFTILCNQRTWKVHKLVLSIHSGVLESSCNGGFKEAREGILDLSEYTPVEVENFVYYLYHWTYNVVGWGNSTYLEDLLLHIDMAIMGDKYLVPGLVAFAECKFSESLDKLYDEEQYAVLAEVALKAYDSPHATTKMRSRLVNAVIELDPEQLSGEAISETMRLQGDFATDIFVAMHKKLKGAGANSRGR